MGLTGGMEYWSNGILEYWELGIGNEGFLDS